MPRVPLSTGPEVRSTALQGGYQQTVDVSAPARQIAQGLGAGADVLDAKAKRDAQDQAWRTQAEISQGFVQWDANERKNSQGQAAKGYAERVQTWWKDAAETYGKDLSPAAKSLISRQLMQAQTTAFEGATRHEGAELERSLAEALDGSLQAEVSRGAAGGPAAAAASVGAIQTNLREYAASKGKAPEWLAAQETRYTTALHASVISSLQQADPSAAKAYFEKWKDQIDGTRHDDIGAKLNQASAANDGEQAADTVWRAQGPRGYNDPVALDTMESALREQFKNDAPRRQAGIAALRERATAHNAAQAEANAGNVNRVYSAIDAGAPMTRVVRSPEWLALPGKEQDQILAQQESRAAAREGRAAAAEQRAHTAEQRRDRKLLLDNGDAYLRYGDPEVLARMTRPQVEATRSVFGFEGAQHLLARFDALQKPGAIIEARMDKQDFDHVAEGMGLDPFNAKTPDKKRQLGELQFRVEQMIDTAQKHKGKALTREEKMTLMQGELARQVTINPGWLMPNRTQPVIQLTPDDAARVVVPDADKAKIAEALKTMYQQNPDNPMFAPTEANMRRLYLMNKSRAAALIPEAK